MHTTDSTLGTKDCLEEVRTYYYQEHSPSFVNLGTYKASVDLRKMGSASRGQIDKTGHPKDSFQSHRCFEVAERPQRLLHSLRHSHSSYVTF
jgi:hypothetical protein